MNFLNWFMKLIPAGQKPNKPLSSAQLHPWRIVIRARLNVDERQTQQGLALRTTAGKRTGAKERA